MKAVLSIVIFCLVIMVFVSSAKCEESLATKLKDGDASERLLAWQSLGRDDNDSAKKLKQLLSLLPEGLRDSAPEVRACVAKLAAQIAFPSFRQKKSLFSENPQIAKALTPLVNDEDRNVRKNALRAIGIGVEPTKELEDLLLARYPKEPDADCRELLIDNLEACGKKWAPYDRREPSQRAIEVIIKALNDPSATVSGAAARAIWWMKTPPPEALPKLADKLDASNSYTCQFVVLAIGHYGPAARQYLPKLEGLRAEVENLEASKGGDSLRANLDSAIRIIREGNEKQDNSHSHSSDKADAPDKSSAPASKSN